MSDSAAPAGLKRDRLAGGAPGVLRASPGLGALAACILVNGILVLWLAFWGHSFLPASGTLDLFNADMAAEENSQHLSDPYSALHVVFGMALFLIVARLKPAWPTGWKLIVAICGSGAWEMVENTPAVIALFTDSSQAGAYHGDSIVNALSDMVFVIIGFAFSARAGRVASLAFALVIEASLALTIHDGLVLGSLRVFGVI